MDQATTNTQIASGTILGPDDIREFEDAIGICNARRPTEEKQSFVDRAIQHRIDKRNQTRRRYLYYRSWGDRAESNTRRPYLQARTDLTRLLFLTVSLGYDPSGAHRRAYTLCCIQDETKCL